MHSEKFEKIKRFFILKVWNEVRVRNAVKMNWITEKEFTEITGKEF